MNIAWGNPPPTRFIEGDRKGWGNPRPTRVIKGDRKGYCWLLKDIEKAIAGSDSSGKGRRRKY